jgi:polyisoprenoid-binding protein YceI
MKTARTLFTLAALAASALPALAADYSLELRPERTKVQFTLSDPLHTVHGTFSLKRGTIAFNPDTGAASGEVVVDVTSGESGSDARDSRMHANVLESKKYPEAVFTPSRIEGTVALQGTSTIKLHGTFTIHGATHEMTMDVQTSARNEMIQASMSFDIPYVAWGMKDPSTFLLKVSKTVQMTIQTAAPLDRR